MDLIRLMQLLTQKYLHNAEDAGYNMYNIYLRDELDTIVQVYIDDSVHDVFIVHYTNNADLVTEHVRHINDLDVKEQVTIFDKFYHAITK